MKLRTYLAAAAAASLAVAPAMAAPANPAASLSVAKQHCLASNLLLQSRLGSQPARWCIQPLRISIPWFQATRRREPVPIAALWSGFVGSKSETTAATATESFPKPSFPKPVPVSTDVWSGRANA